MRRTLDVTALAAGLALIGVGTLLVLDAEGELDLTFGWLAPLLIGAIGAVLVASGAAARPTTPPRPRLAGDGIHTGVSGRRGNHHRPATLAALAPSYRVEIGTLDIDLSALELPPGTTTRVAVRAGMGEARVLAPAGAHVVVDGRASIGQIVSFGLQDGGVGVRTRRELEGPGGRLELDVSTGIGKVSVARA